MKDDVTMRKQLVHIARKFGGSNLLYGAANALHDPSNPRETGMPSDYGIDAGKHVPVNKAVRLVLSMTSRAKLRELIDNGELEFCTSLACELDETPQPLTGPVDINHVLKSRDSNEVEHWITSHNYCLASFDNLSDALEHVRSHRLELDKVCGCAHAAARLDPHVDGHMIREHGVERPTALNMPGAPEGVTGLGLGGLVPSLAPSVPCPVLADDPAARSLLQHFAVTVSAPPKPLPYGHTRKHNVPSTDAVEIIRRCLRKPSETSR
jgi:hypothetical protein